MSLHVAQYILWLDVPMTNALCMDVSNGPHELIGIKLDDEVGDHLLHFMVLLHHSVSSVRDVVGYHIQIHFIWFISIRIKALPNFNAIWVMEHFQNRQLTIFVSFVLEYLFNGNGFPCFSNGSLENHSK